MTCPKVVSIEYLDVDVWYWFSVRFGNPWPEDFDHGAGRTGHSTVL